MVSIEIKNTAGQQIEFAEYDSAVFAVTVVPRLLRDSYLMYEACRRQGTAAVKTKGLISGSKKKMFRQKGTGNARMGQKRTPLRRGGGSAFGKVSKDWGYRLPKKALRVATRMAIAGKFNAGDVSVVDQLQVSTPKTKVIADLLRCFSVGEKSCLLVVGGYSRPLWLASRNIPGLTLTTSEWLNSYDVIKHRVVLLTREALSNLLERFKI